MFPANKFIRTEKTDMIVGTIRKATYIARSQPKNLIMRQVILLLMLFLCISIANAQSQKKKHTFYATGELNLGNYFGGDLNLNYVLKEKYTFKIGYTGNVRTATSIPEDYDDGFFLLMPFWSSFSTLDCSTPKEHIGNYRFDVGRIYKLNPSGTIRINAALGLGYTTVTEPVWKKKKQKCFLFFCDGPNYSWNYKEKRTISLIINPKIEFAFTRIFGFTISPMVQINKYRTYFGIGIGTMLGVLR